MEAVLPSRKHREDPSLLIRALARLAGGWADAILGALDTGRGGRQETKMNDFEPAKTRQSRLPRNADFLPLL